MAQITIRELSDKAKEALRVQAAQSGLSLEAHVRQILQQASTGKGLKPAIFLIWQINILVSAKALIWSYPNAARVASRLISFHDYSGYQCDFRADERAA